MDILNAEGHQLILLLDIEKLRVPINISRSLLLKDPADIFTVVFAGIFGYLYRNCHHYFLFFDNFIKYAILPAF